jgi:hypothetical protein
MNIWTSMDSTLLMVSESIRQKQSPDGPTTIRNDRRHRKRYEIRMAIAVTGATPSHRLIAGWSVDVSGIGIRIESDVLASYDPFPSGTTVVVAAEWPVLRDGNTPLRLIMIGDIVRSTSHDLAVRIARYYFEPHNTCLRAVTEHYV